MEVSKRYRKDPANSGSIITELEITMTLTGKRALVSGASRGLGAAIAKALARELGPREVTANLVQLGSIDTDMFLADGPRAETAKQFMASGRYGAPEGIADMVAFLASAKAQYITGAALTVEDGANA